ncbi:MAG: Rrf2 family transcriptional regulator [Polaromonas sp.]|uniref:Rrf2 family transcriptional regulator n=1 Tax=Polaromonas sp. TaxID=1869339 RepID=UPI00271A4BDF|nr:Rrf2 family transcriptional regulator [Polaromonas sp.]MDO9115547.1 Rrf2 family transcriptional regulator [Polaromonas sp.]MDP1885749.1 Rrf2 family transcriptional regulator [Polaromonas sp.]
MKLTAFTDYSLRVLIYLAAQPQKRATIAEIAASFDVSENHLTKVVHLLGKNGWLANVRGKGGGLELAMPPELVGVGAVVRQTEGAAVVAECFSDEGNHCAITRICRLRGVLGEAVEAFYTVLDRYTLADLVQNRQSLAKVLFIDRTAPPTAAKRAA